MVEQRKHRQQHPWYSQERFSVLVINPDNLSSTSDGLSIISHWVVINPDFYFFLYA